MHNVTKGYEFAARADLTERQRRVILAGGLLAYARQENDGTEVMTPGLLAGQDRA